MSAHSVGRFRVLFWLCQTGCIDFSQGSNGLSTPQPSPSPSASQSIQPTLGPISATPYSGSQVVFDDPPTTLNWTIAGRYVTFVLRVRRTGGWYVSRSFANLTLNLKWS